MTQATGNEASSQTGLYPIRTVSELTGVNAITLRAWERRYSLFEPVRKSSGHRLYSQDHIDLITRIVGLLDRGMRIGQVKAWLENQASEADTEDSESSNLWSRYIGRMIAAIIKFNEEDLELTYGEALSHYPVHVVTEELLMPLLRELGERWETNKGSIAEEHFFGFYLRNKLGARFHHRARGRNGPVILLACLPGDRHEVGLLLFALAASELGYQTIVLGADMPVEELPAAAAKTGSKAIVLSGLVKPPKNLISRELKSLVSDVDIPVFVGGKVSITRHDALVKAKTIPMGTDLESALKRLLKMVPVSPED